MTLETQMFTRWYERHANEVAGETPVMVCHLYRVDTKSVATDAMLWKALYRLHRRPLVNTSVDTYTSIAEFTAEYPRPESISGLRYGGVYVSGAYGIWGGREFTAELVYLREGGDQFAGLQIAGFRPTDYVSNRSVLQGAYFHTMSGYTHKTENGNGSAANRSDCQKEHICEHLQTGLQCTNAAQPGVLA